MAVTRYSTNVTLCEDTSQNFELYDLLRQADPNYAATDPARVSLYVFDGTKYVETTTGYFTAVDKDTFTVDVTQLPNFNGVLKVRVLGTDSSGASFILDLNINVTPVNDAPSGADDSVALANGSTYVFGVGDFGFTDSVEGDALKSVVITTTPASGQLNLNGTAVAAGQEILAADIAAGNLTYVAPVNSGGAINFDFQVRDTGGTDGCGGNDLDLTPNTITFVVPAPLPATLGDRVWEDKNANGVQDAGEAGIQGVTVQLKDASGTVVKTTTTDVNGNYGFEVAPGTYSVAIVTPGGYVVTGQDLGGNEGTDSDINAAGQTAPVTLAAGQNNPNVDAGLYKLAELGDRVWLDTNGNGQQDGGEAGVQGVKVTLLDANGAAVGSPLLTDVNGNYLFTNLKPGTYSVQFDKATLPAGYSFTTRDSGADATDSDANTADGKTIQTQLDSGESDKTWDAGIVANPGAITGTVRQDNDNNDTGDTPIAGVTVVLKDSAGNVVGTTTTDANGNYAFNNLPAGSYTVMETNKPGYLDVNDIDGGNPNSIAVTLNPGQTSTGNDFVDELPATLGDRVWEDKNANGVQDAGESGIQGVTVKLLDSNGAVLNSMTTDANGNYLFSNLSPGNYAVQIMAPTGYTITGKDLGGNDATDSDIDPTTGKTIVTTLSAGENDLSWDAGLYKKASLGDRVWLDANKNGVQDSGEAGVAGVAVNLLNAAGAVVATSTTNASGNYLFQNLMPGSYAVQVVAPNGYVITGKDLGGNDATDSDVDAATGKTVVTTLESGENDLSWDAGLYQNPASIGDRVWLDKNANGVQDAGETGIAGVAVKLLNSAGAVVGSATTDANGNYLFSNLTPGDYAVQIVAPTGYTITGKDLGGNDATDSDVDAATGKTVLTTLTAGESDLSWDAGLYQKASIGDKVWSDCDADGVQDATEAGVGGVVVKLLNAAGTVVASTTTDANGNYLFKDLVPGDYAIQVVAPTGTTLTTKDQGGNDALDSDVDTVTGKSALTTLVSGENDMSWDAGLRGARVTASFDFNGNSASDGTDGNIRSYTNNGISVNASAFSRDKTSGAWSAAWLGTYGGGLGVTNSSEGSGTANNVHTIDNDGRVDYVLFEFSKVVTVDKAYLGYVIGDSDMKIWIGNSANAFTSHVTLSDAVLSSMGFTEVNSTTSSSARWADLNAGNIEGNMLIVSAATTDSNDYFKLQNLVVSATTCVSTAPVTASIGDRVWEDMNANGVQDAGEAGIAGVTVKLLNSSGAVVATTTTNASGNYLFNNVTPGDFKVQVVKPTGYYTTGKDLGGNDATDSDVDSTGTTVLTTLTAGENDLSWDAGLYRKASIGDRVWEDVNHNNLQDAGEAGIANVTVKLQNAAGTTIATTTTNTSGNYSFVNLDPGSYRVVFDKSATIYKGIDMSNWSWSSKDIGTNDSIDADAYSTSDVATTAYTTLVSGEADMTWDAGITPIVLDLDGNGIQTIAREDSSGKFDLLGTGHGIDSGWISAGDAFLAFDANRDGKVNNLSELFGGVAKGDGFAKLADFDSNNDGLIDALDARFSELQVWQDINGNHQTDAGELRSLAEAGVLSLRTDFVELPAIDAQGNLHLERSSAQLVGGASIDMADVYFNVSRADAEAAGIELPSLSALLGDDTTLDMLLGANTGSPAVAAGGSAAVDGSMATLSQMVSLYDQQQHDLIAA
ncbi:MAG: carboxypeptidase regulatory-like domain-containing protein [Dechloromonas sp.]|nr:carboxypeptidase regulatory-like domain-containing protein [Dechloromonas sp.]